MLCHPCIKRLNIAYSFKKQCVQSAGVLKNYVELVKESQRKNESQNTTKSQNTGQGNAYMLLPNQKYVKILVGSQNQGTTGNTNSFQNVFLNLIPTTTISPVPNTSDGGTQKNKDTNQNVFLNINSTFQKFIPLSSLDPPPLKKSELNKKSNSKESVLKSNVNVSQLFNESNAEEMSVEIDPTSFLSLEHDDSSNSEDESKHDWDEVITKQKIDSHKIRANGATPAEQPDITNGKEQVSTPSNYVPILPKDDLYSGGHFLSSSSDKTDINCESCQKSFPSIRLLKQHLKQFHLGKLPFKCGYCYTEYMIRSEYDDCLSRHKKDQEVQNTSLTLKDFADGTSYESDALTLSLIADTPADMNLEANENGDYVCTVCARIFNSSAGLLRHRVRKHNQKNRKKYFIKGMKNAKCDICNREFSTQSYMQLHRKLHMREDLGYKYKVQGRSKYKNIPDEDGENLKSDEKEKKDDSNVKEESDTDSDSEETPEKKKKVDAGDGVKVESEGNSMSSNDVDMEKNQVEEESESSSENDSNSEEEDGNDDKN